MIINRIGELATWDPDTNSVEYFHNCAIEIEDRRIVKIDEEIPLESHHVDCKHGLVTPGFVDSHTHPVFLHGREMEFRMRNAGRSYQDIAEAGGGINASVNGVRNASRESLVELLLERMDRFLKLGTTTIEAKSGYGLDIESELKSLEAISEAEARHELTVLPTFMGAHAFPKEYDHNREQYIDLVCDEMLPRIAEQGIAEFCDVFCENGYFTVDQSRRILLKARDFGLKLKMHADEFEDSGAANLAGELKVLSADHLMAVSDEGIRALSENCVVATLLPGTTFFLGLNQWAPTNKMIQEGVNIALATDFNPGSCMIQSMPLIVSLACIYLGLTVDQTLASSTYFGAKALGIDTRVGAVKPGFDADLVVWGVNRWEEVPYLVSDIPIRMVIKRGKIVS